MSRIGLGTMTWGEATDTDGAAAQLSAFVDAGGTLVETADGYGDGTAQEVLAKVLATNVPREYVVLGGARHDARRPARRRRGPRRPAHRARRHPAPPRHRPPRPLAAARLRRRGSAGGDALCRSDGGDVRAASATAGWWRRSGWQLATVAERGRALGSIAVPVSAQVEYSLLAAAAEAELLPAAPAPRRRAAGLGAARPRRAHRQVRRRHPGRFAGRLPRARALRRGPPQRAFGPHRAGRPHRGRRARHLPAGGRARLGARPARRRVGHRRGPRRGSAQRVDGDREPSPCPSRSAPRSTT